MNAKLNPNIGDTLTIQTVNGEGAEVTVEDVDGDSIYGIGADGFDYHLREFASEAHLYLADGDDSDWTPVGTVTDVE